MVFWNKDLLFCEISPTTYKISLKKENLIKLKARQEIFESASRKIST